MTKIGTVGGGVDPELEVATSACTGPGIEFSVTVGPSMVSEAACTLGHATLVGGSGVARSAGKTMHRTPAHPVRAVCRT